MLGTMEEHETKQEMMRRIQAERERFMAQTNLLTLAEAAQLLRVSKQTARRLLRKKPGVVILHVPGSRCRIVLIPRSVIETVLRENSVL